jgi:hypothetical protein
MNADEILNAALEVPKSNQVLIDMQTKQVRYIRPKQIDKPWGGEEYDEGIRGDY